MNISRRSWCQTAGLAMAAGWGARAHAGVVFPARIRLVLDNAVADNRGNLAGYRELLREMRALEPRTGAEHLIVPAEAGLTLDQWRMLLDDVAGGAHALIESPALAGSRSPVILPHLSMKEGPPTDVFRESSAVRHVNPYVRLTLQSAAAETWYLRHDSDIAAIEAPRAEVVARFTQDDRVVGARMRHGRGSVVYLGTRLGAPAGRGDRAAQAFLSAWLLA